MRPIQYVEKFNDWSVRKYDGAEMEIDGQFYHGMITELSEEGIMFRPFTINEERANDEDWSANYPKMFVRITDFDNINLEIWDEHRGGDDSSIGLSGYFTEWRHVWPDENIAVKEMTYEYLKSLEPKQLALDF